MALGRREFLQVVGAGLAAAGCAGAGGAGFGGRASKPKNILVMGGTGFIGPPIVRTALARGHRVTLFNRGKTNPGLFPQVELIAGDRRFDIDKLKGREWDAVIDTWVLLPKTLRASTALLKDHVGHYLYVSTISVYKLGREPIDERSPVITLPDPTIEKFDQLDPDTYGGLKALAEAEMHAGMPGRATALRAGVIVGPGDPSDRFLYWMLRLQRGGDMLVPGTVRGSRLPFIDARDLADFIVRTVEDRTVGTFNVVGPDDAGTAAVLAACGAALGSGARPCWVPSTWLQQQKADGWDNFPLVSTAEDEQAGFGHVSAARAIARGLRFRAPGVTARDTVAWWKEQPAERTGQPRPGVTAEREAELLSKWRAVRPG
jgi:2'-hydroxyisoflavone reductase